MQLLSLSLSLLGMVLIYVSSVGFEAPTVEISRLDSSYLGKTVKIAGTVEKVYYSKGGHAFLILRDSSGGSIRVVIFKNVLKTLEGEKIVRLKEGSLVTVCGTLDEYEGRLQIVVRSGKDLEVKEIGG